MSNKYTVERRFKNIKREFKLLTNEEKQKIILYFCRGSGHHIAKDKIKNHYYK